MQYRIYTIGHDSGSIDIAIPENRVEAFDAYIASIPDGHDIEEFLNTFGAILVR